MRGRVCRRSHFPGSIRGGLVEICAPALHFFFYYCTGTDVSAEGGLSDACMAGYNALTHSVGASKLLQKFEGVLWLWGWAVNSTTYVRVRSSHVMLLLGRLDQDAGVVGSFGCGRRRIVTRAHICFYHGQLRHVCSVRAHPSVRCSPREGITCRRDRAA